METPEHFRALYTHEEIQERVAEIGASITEWHEALSDNSQDLVVIPILRGGVFLFCDLVRTFPFSIELFPAQAWAYQDNLQPRASGVAVRIDQAPVEGRNVLVVDDICDSGKTLHEMQQALLQRGAVDVEAAVAIQREIREPAYRPRWVCFEYDGPEWLVGYGMDDSERFRNLREICVIEQEGKG